jgi:tRNA 2-selenouridine synthase
LTEDEWIESSRFREIILDKTSIIDVRAPVEFADGSLPGSVNLPILSDLDRHQVGTAYKQQGQAAAITLGQSLVSGAVKDTRLQSWIDFLKLHPSAVITCFRGGLRSKITQEWILQAGVSCPRLKGGYKAFRHFLREEMDRLSMQSLCVVSGATGSGKTQVLKEIQTQRPTVDLEGLACHRGSAFGAYSKAQPTQIDFENQLSEQLIRIEDLSSKKPIVVEDESRMIGKCVQPEKFFESLRASPLIFIEEPLESRIEEICQEYILRLSGEERLGAYLRYETALQRISSKLGDLRFRELREDLLTAIVQSNEHDDFGKHKIWIEKLLVWYYDPVYTRSLEQRKPRILFQGSRKAVKDFLLQ